YDTNLKDLKTRFDKEREQAYLRSINSVYAMTFNEWFEEWFTNAKAPTLKNEVNRVNYKRKVVNTFCAELGEKQLKDISQLNIQTAANNLIEEKGYSIRTIRDALGVVRDCLTSAVVNQLIPFNPCVNIVVRRLNEPKDERVVLSKEEQEIFLQFASNSFYYEAYQILFQTGMRIGEFAGLQWEDINFEKKYIFIQRSLTSAYVNGKKILELTTPKTQNSYRKIPFFKGTEELLRAWQKKQNIIKAKMGNQWRSPEELGNLVFTTSLGSPAARYVITSDIKTILNNINIARLHESIQTGKPFVEFKKVHPHAFRHTFATRCFEKKLSPLFIMKIMGHTKYSTTVSYTHLLEDYSNSEVDKAGSFIEHTMTEPYIEFEQFCHMTAV
ncbi:MAG: site-specific integrase, partial [Clostridia bacterium]|nr:site-specific integrase [Clostridia bacterium]